MTAAARRRRPGPAGTRGCLDAGFDDIELARATGPMLTTVAQPLQEMGQMAVTLLIRLQERHRWDALHVDLATRLVVRDSTGPVPAPAG